LSLEESDNLLKKRHLLSMLKTVLVEVTLTLLVLIAWT